jgi:hypothetical protein
VKPPNGSLENPTDFIKDEELGYVKQATKIERLLTDPILEKEKLVL